MKDTPIEWADHTFNPWIGCTKVSPGCANCYAEAMNTRFKGGNWGKGAPRRRTSPANWHQLLKWDQTKHCTNCDKPAPRWATVCDARGCAHYEFRRPRVFCASMADWLDKEVPIEWFIELMALVQVCENLDFLLLTKRPENFKRRFELAVFGPPPAVDFEELSDQYGRNPAYFMRTWMDGTEIPGNVWIGATVEDQARATERIPALLNIPAKVRFLSVEPLLGPIRLPVSNHQCNPCSGTGRLRTSGRSSCIDCNGRGFTQTMGRGAHTIDWVICGGESGPKARAMHPDWIRVIRDQCAALGVPFFFKQWGEYLVEYDRNKHDPNWQRVAEMDGRRGHWINAAGGQGFHGDRVHFAERVGKKKAGRLLDGAEHNEFPAVKGDI